MSDIASIAAKTLEQAGVHSVTIKDKAYTITLLPATQSLAVATQLFKLFLPSLGAYFDSAESADLVLPEDSNPFTEICLLLVGQLDKISVLEIVTILTQGIKRNGVDIDVDEEFKGDLAGLLTILEYILRENCGNFLADWLAVKGITLPSMGTLMQSQA
jgi:hypothetical protein